MDLQTFIKQTLVEIVRGIEAAGNELKGSSAVVSPRDVVTAGENKFAVYGWRLGDHEKKTHRRPVEAINFDVAVYASEGTETKGGIGIMVGPIGLGSQGRSEAGTKSESRIQFRVPMVLPHCD